MEEFKETNLSHLTNTDTAIELPKDVKVEGNDVVIRPILAFKKKIGKTPWYGKIISWWCKSPYYHVEIILDRKWISASPGEKVYVRDLRPLLKKEWDYVIMPPLTINKEMYENVKGYAYRQHGTKYDMFAILFSMVFPWGLNSGKQWFCSELVVEVLRLLGYSVLYDNQPCTVSPGKLFEIVNLLPEKEMLPSFSISLQVKL